MIRNYKAFTLVELVIVIVIVGILTIVSVPIYNGYIVNAKIAEGKAIAGSIAKMEKAYFAENGKFLSVTGSSFCEELDIDLRTSKYFDYFFVSRNITRGPDESFTVYVLSNRIEKDRTTAVILYGFNDRENIIEIERNFRRMEK